MLQIKSVQTPDVTETYRDTYRYSIMTSCDMFHCDIKIFSNQNFVREKLKNKLNPGMLVTIMNLSSFRLLRKNKY